MQVVNYLPSYDKWWPYLGDIIYIPTLFFYRRVQCLLERVHHFVLNGPTMRFQYAGFFSSVTTLCPVKYYMLSNYY